MQGQAAGNVINLRGTRTIKNERKQVLLKSVRLIFWKPFHLPVSIGTALVKRRFLTAVIFFGIADTDYIMNSIKGGAKEEVATHSYHGQAKEA